MEVMQYWDSDSDKIHTKHLLYCFELSTWSLIPAFLIINTQLTSGSKLSQKLEETIDFLTQWFSAFLHLLTDNNWGNISQTTKEEI